MCVCVCVCVLHNLLSGWFRSASSYQFFFSHYILNVQWTCLTNNTFYWFNWYNKICYFTQQKNERTINLVIMIDQYNEWMDANRWHYSTINFVPLFGWFWPSFVYCNSFYGCYHWIMQIELSISFLCLCAISCHKFFFCSFNCICILYWHAYN